MLRQNRSLPAGVFPFNASVAGMVVACSVALWGGNSAAYEFYSDAINDQGRCAHCHTGFRESSLNRPGIAGDSIC